MVLECMDDSKIEKLLLAGTITWEKYNFHVAQERVVLWVGSTLIIEKHDSVISSTQFSI
jgi:hypothetical protein